MASDRYTWIPDRKRYRDEQSGRLLTERRMHTLRDRWVKDLKSRVRDLADGLDEGTLQVGDWERQMRQIVKDAHVDQYQLGRGGRNVMTQRDWGRLGRALRTQYEYLNGFARDIADGKLSTAQIKSRAAMYLDSTRQSFDRGRERAYGALRLPAYPADGKTACRANCRCVWTIRETKKEWRATWKVNASAEHCADCLRRAARWNPYVQTKEQGSNMVEFPVERIA